MYNPVKESLATHRIHGWVGPREGLEISDLRNFSSLLGNKLLLLDCPAHILVVYVSQLTPRRCNPKVQHYQYQSRTIGHIRRVFHPHSLKTVLMFSPFRLPSQSQLVKSVTGLYSKGSQLEFRPEHRLTGDVLRVSSLPRTNVQV